MLIPKNRHEYYLAVISGNDYPTFPPKIREEQYLAKLAGQEVDVPIPKTPKERAYYNIINDIKFEPENRWQTFVAAANDDSITAPTPRTREEIWWSNITLSQEVIVEYIGTLPAALQTIEGYLESYNIYGNTEQTGTPTPENPIVPSGCGEMETTGAHTGQYKLPILSNSIKTDIYLGEVETTRRIKKLVLTGKENWRQSSDGNIYIALSPNQGVAWTRVLSTHFTSSQIQTNGSLLWFVNANVDFDTVDEYKQYLAAQYANGTPVTVWYVLAAEQTAIVNEQLMRIGAYADTIDSTQTSAQIPTAAGETTISWAGEGLAPSEVELTYKTIKKSYISADDKVYQDLNGQLLGG